MASVTGGMLLGAFCPVQIGYDIGLFTPMSAGNGQIKRYGLGSGGRVSTVRGI